MSLKRPYSTHKKSPHGLLYSTTFPAMIPVVLLGSAVFIGLRLTQSKLAHEKYMHVALERVSQLEAEIDQLQQLRANQTSKLDPPLMSSRWRWW